jgi:hypothetical protein
MVRVSPSEVKAEASKPSRVLAMGRRYCDGTGTSPENRA